MVNPTPDLVGGGVADGWWVKGGGGVGGPGLGTQPSAEGTHHGRQTLNFKHAATPLTRIAHVDDL